MAARKPTTAATSRRIKKVDTTIYPISISGSAYENGVRDRFNVKPIGQRKRGFGYQMKYELGVPDLRKLTDLMAELALDASDAGLDTVMDAFYTDMSRFPKAAGL